MQGQWTNFANALLYLAPRVAATLRQERRVLHLSSPVHVFGDIHGNMQVYVDDLLAVRFVFSYAFFTAYFL